MCLKLLVSTPRGPVILTTRDLSSHVTLSGILTVPLVDGPHGTRVLRGLMPPC